MKLPMGRFGQAGAVLAVALQLATSAQAIDLDPESPGTDTR